MTEAELAEEYVRLLNESDEIKKRTSEVRDIIIEKSKSGIEFRDFGVSVEKRFSYDYDKCAEVYEQKTKQKAPTKIIPEQEVLDVDLLKVLIKREGIKEGTEGFTVKRSKTK